MNSLALFNTIENSGAAIKDLSLTRNEIIASGQANTNIYFVYSGSLRLFLLDGKDEQNIRFGYKNDFIVFMDSFLSNTRSTYTLQALKKTILKVISKTTFQQFLVTDVAGNTFWQQMLESTILQLLEREIDLLTTSPKERYHRLLNRSPKLFQEISNRHIANYLRMSPETLSRLKKR